MSKRPATKVSTDSVLKHGFSKKGMGHRGSPDSSYGHKGVVMKLQAYSAHAQAVHQDVRRNDGLAPVRKAFQSAGTFKASGLGAVVASGFVHVQVLGFRF